VIPLCRSTLSVSMSSIRSFPPNDEAGKSVVTSFELLGSEDDDAAAAAADDDDDGIATTGPKFPANSKIRLDRDDFPWSTCATKQKDRTSSRGICSSKCQLSTMETGGRERFSSCPQPSRPGRCDVVDASDALLNAQRRGPAMEVDKERYADCR
jgi:hypothetical protein